MISYTFCEWFIHSPISFWSLGELTYIHLTHAFINIMNFIDIYIYLCVCVFIQQTHYAIITSILCQNDFVLERFFGENFPFAAYTTWITERTEAKNRKCRSNTV